MDASSAKRSDAKEVLDLCMHLGFRHIHAGTSSNSREDTRLETYKLNG